MQKRRIFKVLILTFSVVMVASCASTSVYQVDLIPTPDVFAEGLINPFPEKEPLGEDAPYDGILYATDRLPGKRTLITPKSRADEVYYKTDRGTLLRLGIGRVSIDKWVMGGREKIGWDEVRQISLMKDRSHDYPLQIKDIKEFGILDRSYNDYNKLPALVEKAEQPTKTYSALINKQLAASKKKDIYIYVHGYNTVFEDPLLVASELWHYMGYDGVFIAYSWPATPRGFAYLADLDTARLSSRNLRIFLEYLSDETDVENIHIVGHSMGTRIVSYTLHDIALTYSGESHAQIHKIIPIGNVFLIGSDLDRGVFMGFTLDGLLNVPTTLNVYMSGTDSALGASNFLFERERLGESWLNQKPTEIIVDYLEKHPHVHYIDVTKAKDSGDGNGHHYFTGSPWVSSDLLLTLKYDFTPEQRGLKLDDYGMWSFEEDHESRLRNSLKKMDPALLHVTE